MVDKPGVLMTEAVVVLPPHMGREQVVLLFGALLGISPLLQLLSSHGALHYLTAAGRHAVTGRAYFPHLISAPFHSGLTIVFAASAALSVLAAVASLMRGKRTAPPSSLQGVNA